MTYEEFETGVKEKLSRIFPVSEIYVKGVTGMNGVKSRVLYLCTSGMNVKVSHINLMKEYNEFQQSGRDFEAYCLRIADSLRNFACISPEFITDNFYSWECVKDQIIVGLVNREWNKELLAGVPWVPFHDLAVVFRVYFKNEHSLLSVLVTNELCSLWGRTTDEIYRQAMDDTCNLVSYEIMGINQMAEDYIGSVLPVPVLYVRTRDSVWGASAILFPGILADIAEKLKGDFYVLPATVHGIIALPAVGDWRQLRSMVQGVNHSEVYPEEILSDNVYVYSCRDRVLRVCKE